MLDRPVGGLREGLKFKIMSRNNFFYVGFVKDIVTAKIFFYVKKVIHSIYRTNLKKKKDNIYFIFWKNNIYDFLVQCTTDKITFGLRLRSVMTHTSGRNPRII